MPDSKTTPASADPEAGHNPGYAETQPRDKGDTEQREPGPRRMTPDDGGLDRKALYALAMTFK